MFKCKICNEEKIHYSLGMCKNCYKKEHNKAQPIIICLVCNKNKKLYLKNKCKACYDREKRLERNNIGICLICNKRKVLLEDKKCISCYNNKTITIECSRCKNILPHFAKNMCHRCYKIEWNRNRKKEVCSKCNRENIIHRRISETYKLCINCYKVSKKEKCVICGEFGIISVRNDDNTIVCSNCYIPIPRLCRYCKEVKQIARIVDEICYDCYNKEYNQKPDVIARKCIYTINRRIKTENSNFSPQDWLYLMNKYEWKCVYCGDKLTSGNRTLDHIIPISRGGEHNKDNLVPCCVSCNSSKNNKLLSEWRKFGGK